VQDTYTPTPTEATCPHCGATATVALERPAVLVASLYCRCPGCRREWFELRGRDGVERYYEPAATAT